MTTPLPGDPIHPGEALSKLARQRLGTEGGTIDIQRWPLTGQWFLRIPHENGTPGSVVVQVSVTSPNRCQFAGTAPERLTEALAAALEEVGTWP